MSAPFHRDFVPDSAVPTKLLNFRVHTDEREFTHMPYSAVMVTGITSKILPVRCIMSNRDIHRDGNEDDGPFTRTTHDVMKDYLHKRDRNKDCLLNSLVMALYF